MHDGYLQDVTDRKLAEEAMAWFRKAVDAIDAPFLGTTREGKVLYWNRAAEQMYGYTAEEVLGKSINFLLPDDVERNTESILEELESGNSIADLQTTRIAKSGERISVSVLLSPVFAPDGTFLGGASVTRRR